MTALPRATPVHETPGRLRLRIAERRGRLAYFERTGARLAECPGVVSVRSNPESGSIVVRHRAKRDGIVAFAEQHALFQLSDAPAEPEPVLKLPSIGPRDLLVLGMIAAAIFQLSRGRLFGPASALLFNAAQIAGWMATSDGARSKGRNGS